MHLGAPEIILIVAVIGFFGVIVAVVPFWFILRKAGFDPTFSFFMLVPIANVVLLFYLAFAEWPALKELQKKTGSQVQ